jgi:UDP-glucose 4-epimerase
MRTVLVTGGAGFLGSHLVDQLLEDGAAVRVLDNVSTGSLTNLQAAADRHARVGGVLNGSRLEVIIGDIRDRELLRKALRGVRYVFHMAALPMSAVSAVDQSEIHAVNVEGTLNVLHGALTEGVWRVVVASCASVYGRPATIPVPEDTPVQPSTLFAASKAAAESYCRAFHLRHQLDAVMLRYFSVYGPRQKSGPTGALIPSLIEALRQHRPLVELDDRNGEDLTYVEDAVAATLAAARGPRAAGRVINVGSGQVATVRDVLGILSDLLRIPGPPDFRTRLGGQPEHIAAEVSLASELLDYAPRVSLNAGLARVVRSMSDVDSAEARALAEVGLDD